MNARGEYGDRLLRGGSLFSRYPYGGAPDDSAWGGWVYRGPQAFHGHEAPTFGRGGLWNRRREAPLGRGGLISSGDNARGEDGNQKHARVGLKIFHTPGDSDRAVRQIETEIEAIVDAVYYAMGVDPSTLRRQFELKDISKMPAAEKRDYMARVNAWKERVLIAKEKASKSPYWAFFQSAVSPIYDEWMKFRWEHKFYNLFTSWEEYEKWLERAKQLRAAVKAKGIRIETPDPVDLSKTLPGTVLEAGGKAIEKTGEAIWEFGKIAKWAAIGALAIGGVVALTSAVSHLRRGTDPIEKYAGLGRRRA